MKLNNFLQLWGSLMAKRPKSNCNTGKFKLITTELIPVIESDEEHTERTEEVQVILTQMYLRLLKRGRPLKDEKEDLYAA